MDPATKRNQSAWDSASEKHLIEYADLLQTARDGSSLFARERELLHPVLRTSPTVVHPQAHPAVPLWTWDVDEPRIRPDRSYFGRSFVNDTFPAFGAVESQWTLGAIVTAVLATGLRLVSLEEYAEPFYRWAGIDAAAWHGRLPNAFSLLARRPT